MTLFGIAALSVSVCFLLILSRENKSLQEELELYSELGCYRPDSPPLMYVIHSYRQKREVLDTVRAAVFFSRHLYDDDSYEVQFSHEGAWTRKDLGSSFLGDGFAVFLAEWYRNPSASVPYPEDTLKVTVKGRYAVQAGMKGPKREIVKEFDY